MFSEEASVRRSHRTEATMWIRLAGEEQPILSQTFCQWMILSAAEAYNTTLVFKVAVVGSVGPLLLLRH